MNILYIGEETRNWVMRLVNELTRNTRNTVTVVVKRYDEYDDDNKVLPIEGVTVIEVDDIAFYEPDTLIMSVPNIEQYDLVYGSHIIICGTVKYIAKKYNIPWGIQVLDIPINMINNSSSRMYQWNCYFEVLKDVTTMTFITHKARDDWYTYTGQYYDDSHVIHYAVYIPDEYRLSGLNINDRYIVNFCALRPYKNVSQATRSLSQLSSLDVKQIVIGKNQGDLEVIRAIPDVEVIYQEQVTEKEKYELIKNASVVVYPQRSEYIGGLSPFEAMYIGTPVLVYDYNILKSLYGEYAFYANKDIPDSYTNELLHLLTVNRLYIKNQLIKGSEHASKNNFTLMATKLNVILRGMVK